MTNNLYKKILFIISIIIFVGLGYVFINNKFNVASAEESGLQSSVTTNKNNNSDFSFIKALSSLNNIKIDVTFFQSSIFKGLKDNSVLLENVTPGRSNPFIPFTQTSTISNNNSIGATGTGVVKSN